jgi:hypothetical protein
VEKSLLFQSTTRTDWRRSNIAVVEHGQSRNSVVASKPYEKFILLRNFKTPNPGPAMNRIDR